MMMPVVTDTRLRKLDGMQHVCGFQNMHEKEKELRAMINPGVESSMSRMKNMDGRQEHGTASFMKLYSRSKA
jgi:hypothetical protein